MGYIIRVDNNEPYHTQRNNAIRAHRTCASTAMVMALRYAGHVQVLESNRQGMQYEDFITHFIHSDSRVIDFWQNHPAKWIRDAYANYLRWRDGGLDERYVLFGNEIHVVLEYAINTLYRSRVVTFNNETPIRDILFSALTGGSAIVSGTFPFKNTILHHIVAVAGFETNQDNITSVISPEDIDVEQVDNLIIDDPYGDYRERYTVHQGNDVIMPIADVVAIIKESGNPEVKRAHIISANVGETAYTLNTDPAPQPEADTIVGRRGNRTPKRFGSRFS